MSELKPCPFCGGEAVLHPRITRINCSECNSVMSGVQGPAPLIKAWNTRPDLKADDDIQKILDKFRPLPCAVCGEPRTLNHVCKVGLKAELVAAIESLRITGDGIVAKAKDSVIDAAIEKVNTIMGDTNHG